MFKYQTMMSIITQRGIHPFKGRIKFVVLPIVADVIFYAYLEASMAYLHFLIQIQTPNLMATLYYTVTGPIVRTQIQMPIWILIPNHCENS